MQHDAALDVITVGRASLDLYAAEIGTDLSDVGMFRTAVGGCPANIAIGTARLGLRSAILTRVGAESIGSGVLAALQRESVDVSAVKRDADRLTALVLLAVQDRESAAHVFYRTDCADMALCEADVEPDFIRRTRCLVVTGTHFSTPGVAAASWKAIRLAREGGAKVVFDIDFRPTAWGLAAHSAGDRRAAISASVSDILSDVIRASDVVVGTEEEFCAALAEPEVGAALLAARQISQATLVCKRGAAGCEIHPHGASLGAPVRGGGFTVDVVNAIGAGDAFMSGFLRGWLDGKDWVTTATWANACGAIAVSRLLCSDDYPTRAELDAFLRDAPRKPVREVAATIAEIHRADTRKPIRGDLFVLACDHRTQFEQIATRMGQNADRFGAFKRLAVAAAAEVRDAGMQAGIICDGQYGAEALFDATRQGLWAARSIEEAGSKPIRFVTGLDVGSDLLSWPRSQTVKCLCAFDLSDPPNVRARQEDQLLRVHQACQRLGREFLLEIIPSGSYADRGAEVTRIVAHLYGIGIRPQWWKLEPFRDEATWQALSDIIRREDRSCRGLLVLGLTSTTDELAESFRVAARFPLVRGFAVGRAIVGAPFEAWLRQEIGDDEARERMATAFLDLVRVWGQSRPDGRSPT